MRVLGDVDAAPEIDTTVLDTKPGDRWLLCSDGLSSYVAEDKIASALASMVDAQDACDRLVKESLDQGAPDNVTVVLVDVDETDTSSHTPPITVGSAATPLSFEGDTARRQLRLPSLLLHPLKATQPDDSHFEPESDEYMKALIIEDRKRARRRRIAWGVFAGLVVALIAGAVVLGYQFTQRHFFVGASDGRVAIFQGVQQDIGPFELSHVIQTTTIDLTDLPLYQRDKVQATINAEDLADAHRIVDTLSDARTG